MEKIMEILIWIIIIIVSILLIRFLRRWIKRLIFIAILLVLAFFIYWIFSPSWAGKLWYNIRTLPQRITSRVSDQNFMDYENYKLNLSKELDDIISDTSENENEENLNDENDTIDEYKKSDSEENLDKKSDETSDDDNSLDDKPTIKAFPVIKKFPDITKPIKKNNSNGVISWYSKSDVLWIINWYIEKNLDDDTDILVTVEYEEDYNDPQKITLQTQPRPTYED